MNTEGTSILVVDDNAVNRGLLMRHLEKEGYRVIPAEGGWQALALIESQSFDLMLLDLIMPEMDGLEVLKRVRRMYTASVLPVIIVTAKDSSSDVVDALALGANDYVRKPVNYPVLFLRVDAQVVRKRAEDELRELNQTLEHKVDERNAQLLKVNNLLNEELSKRKQMQVQLLHSQKLEAVGRLAAGIAHEINTPTQYVGDNTRFLQDAFGDLLNLQQTYARLLETARTGSVMPALIAETEAALEEADLEYLIEEIPKAIEQSLEGLKKISQIVTAMKEFSHPGSQEKESADLNRVIETTITVARNEWKYVAEVVTNFDENLPVVQCLPGELGQVFLNLIVNAAHAIADAVGDAADGKGTITISTRQVGDAAEICISDTGRGVPAPLQHKIFDPFFTTKEVGKGTGQGLAIARSVIVDKHGGTLALESKCSRGATFVIHLPLDEPLVEQRAVAR